jgi:hypothetical protein
MAVYESLGVTCGLVQRHSSSQRVPFGLESCCESLHFVGFAISACLLPSRSFVASPDLHGRFKERPDSYSTSGFLSTCLAMFCTSATLTATAFPSPSPPYHFLCTSHLPSLAFLPHLLLSHQIPICFPDCVVPILAHLLP